MKRRVAYSNGEKYIPGQVWRNLAPAPRLLQEGGKRKDPFVGKDLGAPKLKVIKSKYIPRLQPGGELPSYLYRDDTRKDYVTATPEQVKARELEEQPYIRDFMFTDSDLNYLNENKEYCPDGKCLERSWKAFDILHGKKEGIPSSDQTKKAMNMQSLDVDKEDFNNNTFAYIDKYEDANIPGWSVEGGDFTVDSWDIHGLIQEQGGDNIYAAKEVDDWINLDADIKNSLYSKIPLGSIVGYGGEIWPGIAETAYNTKYNRIANRHSARVVGWNKDGIPVVYNDGKYTTIDDPELTRGTLITNISAPADVKHMTKSWFEEQGLLENVPNEAKYSFNEEDLNAKVKKNSQVKPSAQMATFMNTLSDNKLALINDMNISNDEYNELVKNLSGLAINETSGGSHPEHIIQSVLGTTFGETQGLTQMNINNILGDPKLKKIAEKYGITKERDLFDASKSAIASMIYAADAMPKARRLHKAGLEEGLRTFSPNSRNQTYPGNKFLVETKDGNSKYVDILNVPFDDKSTASEFFKISDKELKEISDKLNKEAGQDIYTARYENNKVLIDKKTKGNKEDLTDQEILSYYWQAPNALASGDAQGNSYYVKKAKQYADAVIVDEVIKPKANMKPVHRPKEVPKEFSKREPVKEKKKTFKEAFAAARKAGVKEFEWTSATTGKTLTYTTNVK